MSENCNAKPQFKRLIISILNKICCQAMSCQIQALGGFYTSNYTNRMRRSNGFRVPCSSIYSHPGLSFIIL